MRNLTLGAQTALESSAVRPVFLVSCGFYDQTIYMWTGIGNLSWNGQTWVGVGNLGTISPIAEVIATQAQGITLSLSGIPQNLLNEALGQVTTAKQAQVYLGFLDNSGNIIADPIPAFVGLMDQPSIDLSTESATISISVENRLSDLNRARGGRYTEQDQRARHPNDGGLKYVAWLQDQFINWRG